MEAGSEERHAALMRGAAISMGCGAGEGRRALSPLTSFFQEQRNHSPNIQLSVKRKNCKGHNSVVNTTGAQHVRRSLDCENLEPNNNRADQAIIVHIQRKSPVIVPLLIKKKFKDRVVTLYHDYLPAEVINEICQLVHDYSVPNCKSCIFQVENLVIRVL